MELVKQNIKTKVTEFKTKVLEAYETQSKNVIKELKSTHGVMKDAAAFKNAKYGSSLVNSLRDVYGNGGSDDFRKKKIVGMGNDEELKDRVGTEGAQSINKWVQTVDTMVGTDGAVGHSGNDEDPIDPQLRPDVEMSLKNAQVLAKKAKDAIDPTKDATRRQKLYFGDTVTKVQMQKVKDVYNKAEMALDKLAIDKDSARQPDKSPQGDATVNTYAYVYRQNDKRVHIAEMFWKAKEKGTDSRTGTLLHESTHFNTVAGTRDHKYGKDQSQALATANPDDARNNADNYEYYAENV